jgi:hypothetical protein
MKVVVLLLSVLCFFSIVQSTSKLESLKIPSAKSLKACLIARGQGHFAKKSQFIEMYSNQDIYLSTIDVVVQTEMRRWTLLQKDQSHQLRKEDLLDCLLQDVPKEDVERVKTQIEERTCK